MIHQKINTIFSIRCFQYHIFNTLFSKPHATVKFVFFTKKIVKLKMRLQNRYFDEIFSWKWPQFCFMNESFWRNFLHYDGFTKNVPILASENTALNSCSKPYDNWLCIPTCISILKISRWCCICTLINTGSTNRK